MGSRSETQVKIDFVGKTEEDHNLKGRKIAQLNLYFWAFFV